MRILAVDTATERCSVALKVGPRLVVRAQLSARDHAKLILPMIEAVLEEGGVRLGELEGLAFGRGPGGFTGVRLAVATAQGLGAALGIPVLGVSDLAAVAQPFAGRLQLGSPILQGQISNRQILVCMDARMGEVYWARFALDERGEIRLFGEERVGPPETVPFEAGTVIGVGTGFGAYEILRSRSRILQIHDSALPHAVDIARLAEPPLAAGKGVAAAEASPVYIRDKVVR